MENIKSGIVCRNDDMWQGHPDVAYYNNKLFIVYRESDQHRPLGLTRICIIISSDGGKTFSAPITIDETEDRFNCPRLSIVNDSLYVVCDCITATKSRKDFVAAEDKEENTKIIFWQIKENKNKISVESCRVSMIKGILPDHINKTHNGYLITTTHTRAPFGRLRPTVWISKHRNDIYGTWDRYPMISDQHAMDHCEGSICVIRDRYICFLRSHSHDYSPGFYCTSVDGQTWSKLRISYMFGCHRPVVGILRSGNIMVTYRMNTSFAKGYWAKNTCACLYKEDNVLTGNMRDCIILPIDHDSSKKSDGGYTGWVQLPNNHIFMVNYITDDAPLPYIKWYRFKETNF